MPNNKYEAALDAYSRACGDKQIAMAYITHFDTIREALQSRIHQPTPELKPTDYIKYRGRCKEYCDRAVRLFPQLKLVRGHYYDSMWGEQPHWWCARPDGSVFDPTAKQFESKGNGEYVEFDGKVSCSECGHQGQEDDFDYESNYAFCSGACHLRFVGLGDFIRPEHSIRKGESHE